MIAPANTMADVSPALRQIGRRNLEALGYQVRIGANVDRRHFHTAGTLEERLADLRTALLDPEVLAVMPVFGGYNCNQLLPHLDYDLIRRSNKVFIGYSDVTALLLAVGKLAGVPAIHGPSFASLCDPNLFDYTRDGLAAVLSGNEVRYRSPHSTADDAWYMKEGHGPRDMRPFDGWKVYRPGTAEGPIAGGNLETLCALAGTPYFPDLDGHLLFVEDTSGTSPGAFHRGLTQLGQMGVLERIRGLVIGKSPSGTRLDDPACLHAILDDVLRAAPPYPVLHDVSCSHVDPMMSIALFREASLDTSGPMLIVNRGAPAVTEI